MAALGNGTTIDGTSQTAFTGDTNANGPEIVLDGSNFAMLQTLFSLFGPGLIVRAANCTIKGLTIQNFNERGIDLRPGHRSERKRRDGKCDWWDALRPRAISFPAMLPTESGFVVPPRPTMLFRGITLARTRPGQAHKPNSAGIVIYAGAHDNTIGGTGAGARNVISGNTFQAVYVGDAGTNNNLVQGNYIGVSRTEMSAVPNGSGIEIVSGSQSNTIGGTSGAARNVISGNNGPGVLIHEYQDVTMVGNA